MGPIFFTMARARLCLVLAVLAAGPALAQDGMVNPCEAVRQFEASGQGDSLPAQSNRAICAVTGEVALAPDCLSHYGFAITFGENSGMAQMKGAACDAAMPGLRERIASGGPVEQSAEPEGVEPEIVETESAEPEASATETAEAAGDGMVNPCDAVRQFEAAGQGDSLPAQTNRAICDVTGEVAMAPDCLGYYGFAISFGESSGMARMKGAACDAAMPGLREQIASGGAAAAEGTDMAAADDAVEPEIAEPEIVEPEIVEPEIVEPEIMEPEIVEPEIAETETAETPMAGVTPDGLINPCEAVRQYETGGQGDSLPAQSNRAICDVTGDIAMSQDCHTYFGFAITFGETSGMARMKAAACDATMPGLRERIAQAGGTGAEDVAALDQPEEMVEPEIVEPEIAEPEIVEPEIVEPEIVEPEIAQPEIVEPETAEEFVEEELIEPETMEETVETEIVEPEIVEETMETDLAETDEPGLEEDPDFAREIEAEIVFWESVAQSGDPDMLQAYLDQYPDGQFAALAQIQIAKLSGAGDEPDVPETDPAELALWQAVQDSDDIGKLQSYLAAYPDGEFAALAQVQIEELEAEASGGVNDTQAELAFWDSVKDSQSPEMLRAYLDAYPEGHFAPIAQLRIDELTAMPAEPEPETETEPEAEPEAETPQDIYLAGRAIMDAAADKGEKKQRQAAREARQLFKQAAEAGNADAAFAMGEILEKGLAGKQNTLGAAKWYLQAAQNGMPMAYSRALPILDQEGKHPRFGNHLIEFYKTQPQIATSLLQNASRPSVKAVQRRLKSGGFYGGAIDGDFGAHTRAALEHAATGVKPQAAATTTTRTTRTTTTSNRRILAARVQQQLRRVGCYWGPIDGIWGRQSAAAVYYFNRRTGARLSTRGPSQRQLAVLSQVNVRVCR